MSEDCQRCHMRGLKKCQCVDLEEFIPASQCLTDEERDQLRDWWDEETTMGVESAFPIISRLLAERYKAGLRDGRAGDEGWTTLVDEHGKVLAFLDDLKRESERGRGGDIAGMVDAYLGRPDVQVERIDKHTITIGGSRPLAANDDQERRIREMSADQRDKLARLLGKKP